MTNTTPSQRGGFTLLETLFVIGIIGILVALLLPAVQSSRESARAHSCQNNLRQLALAVQNYEHAIGVFPPGVVNNTRPIRNLARGYQMSWIVQILPYCEEKNAWRRIDFRFGASHARNQPVAAYFPRLLACPSDANMAPTSYAGVHHDVEAPIDVDDHGVFFLNSRVRRIDVRDGLAHTLFLGEKRGDPADLPWMFGTRATLRNTGTPLEIGWKPPGAAGSAPVAVEEGFSETVEETIIDQYGLGDLAPPADPPADDGMGVSDFEMGMGAMGMGAMGGTGTGGFEVGGFSSSHQAGVHFAFGDGRVRLIPQNFDLATLQQLAHRADGQLLNYSDE